MFAQHNLPDRYELVFSAPMGGREVVPLMAAHRAAVATALSQFDRTVGLATLTSGWDIDVLVGTAQSHQHGSAVHTHVAAANIEVPTTTEGRATLNRRALLQGGQEIARCYSAALGSELEARGLTVTAGRG